MVPVTIESVTSTARFVQGGDMNPHCDLNRLLKEIISKAGGICRLVRAAESEPAFWVSLNNAIKIGFSVLDCRPKKFLIEVARAHVEERLFAFDPAV